MNCKRYIRRASGHPHHKHEPGSNCLRKARVFYRVTYSEIAFSYLKNGRQDDGFGFCEECAKGMDKRAAWRRGNMPGEVSRLRGTVKAVVPCTEAEATGERDTNAHADIKARVKAIMGQRNHEKIEPETWAEIFRDCVDEVVVEKTMNC
jgi:hypothetical protein